MPTMSTATEEAVTSTKTGPNKSLCNPAENLPETQPVRFDDWENSGERVQECIDKMYELLMAEYPHMVGLAANQIGYPFRIILIPTQAMRPDKKGGKSHYAGFRIIINPVFVPNGNGTTDQLEGCYSVQNSTSFLRVRRIMFGSVSGYMPNGVSTCVNLAGFPCTVAQHEIDHLNRVSIIDRNKELIESVGKVYVPTYES